MTRGTRPLSVLRVHHSGVVSPWRERERELVRRGAAVTLVTPRRWREARSVVRAEADRDPFVRRVRTFGRHPYRFVYSPFGVWRAMRSDRFDVIDVNEEPASLAVAEVRLIAWLARRRAPLCLYSAQNIQKRYPVPFRWLERAALRQARAVHTCNDAVTAVLRAKGFRGLVRNLGLGVDVPPLAAASGIRSRTAALRIGYVGRLDAHKGVSVLVDAVAMLDEGDLVIIGRGPERAALERQVQRLALGERVQLAGFVAHDEVAARCRELDVVVIPSLETPGWVEQFGRAAVEAMAAGVPVVASRCGALPEVLDGAAIFVPPNDPEDLAEALRSLARDDERRRQLAELGKVRAEHFSWSAVAARQLALYREVVDGN